MTTDRLLSPQELADYLAVKLGWVYRQSETGKIPLVKVGKYNRYNLNQVLEALSENGGDHV